jgi:hypothetical protein
MWWGSMDSKSERKMGKAVKRWWMEDRWKRGMYRQWRTMRWMGLEGGKVTRRAAALKAAWLRRM